MIHPFRLLPLVAAVLLLVGCGASDYQIAIKTLAEMRSDAKPALVAHQCDWVKKNGVLPKEYSSRCADAYIETAKNQIAVGKATFAQDNLNSALSLGADPKLIKPLQAQASSAIQKEAREAKIAKDIADKAAKAQGIKDGILARRAYGELLRNKFLDDGADIKVAVLGSKADSLKLTYVLFNDVWAHKMQKGGGLADEAFGLGFKRLELTDSYKYDVEITPAK